MSDTYIPEFMELDSYWRKAVEDAISDTLKGEKRLYLALKNRKKINKKLEMLGLLSAKKHLKVSHGNEVTRSSSEESTSSTGPQTSRPRGKSWTRSVDGSPLEPRPKTPERPLLGDGSLEKMKKSQNSFNLEPMGVDCTNEDSSESDGMETPRILYLKDKNKGKSRWCTEGRSYPPPKRAGDDLPEKPTMIKDKSCVLDDKLDFRLPKRQRSNSFEAKQLNVERKLQLALAKRDILNKNLKLTSLRTSWESIKITESAKEIAGKKKKNKGLLSPFVKFYLEVYRELCHKCKMKEIEEEAARRWRKMNSEAQIAKKYAN